MEALASFSSSAHGQLYSRMCRHFGQDPGAIFDDDVMAHNFRVALFMGEMDEAQETAPAAPEDDIEAAWALAGKANRRAWLGGV